MLVCMEKRVGAIHVIPSTVESNDSLNRAIKSQLNRIIRSELSNPPAYGSKIVATILNDQNYILSGVKI